MSNGAPQDPDYRLKARALWEYHGERLRFTSQVNADYGKWLLVTITSTHLAAIYLVSQESVPAAVRENPWCYWPFVIGLCLVLIGGLVVWANWGLSSTIFADWMNVAMLTEPSAWPTNITDWRKWAMPLSFYTPIVFGILSALCIPWGATEILSYQPPKTAYVITQIPPKPAQPMSLQPPQAP